MDKEQMEEEFEKYLRKELSDEQFWEYVKRNYSVDTLLDDLITSFINNDDETQEEMLEQLEWYKEEKFRVKKSMELLGKILTENPDEMITIPREKLVEIRKVLMKGE